MRAAEKQIDDAYLGNPLTKMSFGEAAWYYRAFCEERITHQIIRVSSGIDAYNPHAAAALADALMNQAKWPLRWLRKACPDSNRLPGQLEDDRYSASWDLSKLSAQYNPFEAAFTYASLQLLQLRLEGSRIVSSDDFRKDTL